MLKLFLGSLEKAEAAEAEALVEALAVAEVEAAAAVEVEAVDVAVAEVVAEVVKLAAMTEVQQAAYAEEKAAAHEEADPAADAEAAQARISVNNRIRLAPSVDEVFWGTATCRTESFLGLISKPRRALPTSEWKARAAFPERGTRPVAARRPMTLLLARHRNGALARALARALATPPTRALARCSRRPLRAAAAWRLGQGDEEEGEERWDAEMLGRVGAGNAADAGAGDAADEAAAAGGGSAKRALRNVLMYFDLFGSVIISKPRARAIIDRGLRGACTEVAPLQRWASTGCGTSWRRSGARWTSRRWPTGGTRWTPASGWCSS